MVFKSTFDDVSDGANTTRCFEYADREISEKAKYGFGRKCRDFTYKRLTYKVLGSCIWSRGTFFIDMYHSRSARFWVQNHDCLIFDQRHEGYLMDFDQFLMI